jgi:DNA repair ATPase RecN
MRNFRNALKHINKEHLSTQKVELGIAQDYASASIDALESIDDAENLIKSLKSLNGKADIVFKKISKAENDIIGIAQKMISKVKELGIDENKLPEIKKARQLQKKLVSIRKDLLNAMP